MPYDDDEDDDDDDNLPFINNIRYYATIHVKGCGVVALFLYGFTGGNLSTICGCIGALW